MDTGDIDEVKYAIFIVNRADLDQPYSFSINMKLQPHMTIKEYITHSLTAMDSESITLENISEEKAVLKIKEHIIGFHLTSWFERMFKEHNVKYSRLL